MTTEPIVPATETPVPPVTPEPTETPVEQTEQEAETAFAEGFNKARDEESPAPTPKTDDVPAEASGNEPATPTADARIQELYDKIPGLEQQFAQQLNTEIRKVYGKFGEIQQTLKGIKPGQPTLKLQGALKRLEKEYPEIAQMLSEDLAEALTSPETPASTTGQPAKQEDIAASINQAVESAVAKVSQQYEVKLLNELHSDWQTLSKEKEFDTFLKSLPGKQIPVTMADGQVLNFPEKAKEYIESNEARTTAECFTKYKAWKTAGQKSRTQNQERLEGAITPSGGTTPPPASIDDESAFLTGFKSVRGGAS